MPNLPSSKQSCLMSARRETCYASLSSSPCIRTSYLLWYVRLRLLRKGTGFALRWDLYRERGAELQAQAAEDKAETDRLGEELAALLAQTRAVEEDKERLQAAAYTRSPEASC
jgi:hypothetical protein